MYTFLHRFRFLEMRNLRRRIKLTYKFSDDEDDVSDITDEGSDYEDPDDPPVPKKQKLDSKPVIFHYDLFLFNDALIIHIFLLIQELCSFQG